MTSSVYLAPGSSVSAKTNLHRLTRVMMSRIVMLSMYFLLMHVTLRCFYLFTDWNKCYLFAVFTLVSSTRLMLMYYRCTCTYVCRSNSGFCGVITKRDGQLVKHLKYFLVKLTLNNTQYLEPKLRLWYGYVCLSLKLK